MVDTPNTSLIALTDFVQNSLDWAASTLATHKRVAGIDGDDEVQVRHLLVSLLVYCQVRGIDFDELLPNANDVLRAAHHGDF